MKHAFVLLTAIFMFSAQNITAQNDASASTQQNFDFSEFEVVDENTVSQTSVAWEDFDLELEDIEEWTFHTDLSSRLLYIDFEQLGGKMSKFYLKDTNGNTIIEDDRLFDLPSNTIYEVNLDKLKMGAYIVELHTFDSVINQEILITE